MRVTFLMTQKVVSYSDAMNMPLDRFIALERMLGLVTDLKSGAIKTTKSAEVPSDQKAKLSGLNTVHYDDLNLPDHYKAIF